MKVLIGDNKKAADKQISDQKDATKSLKKSTSDTITALGTNNAAAIKKDESDISKLTDQQTIDKKDIATLNAEHTKQLSDNTAMGKLNTK